ncbi:Uncharacterised protein [Mycobacteroides abscessus]|nr:Uncharacterised protein [Mycobacteroides abscessus]
MGGHVGKQVSAFDTGRCFQPLFGHVDARAFDTHQFDVTDPDASDMQGLQKSPRLPGAQRDQCLPPRIQLPVVTQLAGENADRCAGHTHPPTPQLLG